MNKKLFTIGLTCFIALLLITPIAQAQDDRPMVHLVYFRASDTEPRAGVDAEIDALVKKAQLFFADEMERHGYGRKTFQIESDAQGNAIVHHVVGRFPYTRYLDNFGWIEETAEQINFPERRIIVYMVDTHGREKLPFDVGGHGANRGRFGGWAGIYAWGWLVIAHELGHVFGLHHDFRHGHGRYLMSYGFFPSQMSPCAAEFLDAHYYFNANVNSVNEGAEPSTIEMLPPSFVASPNILRLRFSVTDPDGLHQAQLLTSTVIPGVAFGFPELVDCKALNGRTSTAVEFVTNTLTTKTESVDLRVFNMHGQVTVQSFPIDVNNLLPPAEVISIPDINLAATVRKEIGSITTHSMLNLYTLNASKSEITDLTGLEHASSLTRLTLDSNNISDVSALSVLKQLEVLSLSDNNISDISVLSELKNLTTLGLNNNNIPDVLPLSKLTRLERLYLGSNAISDISLLSGLTNLTWLDLGSNAISDISLLSGLTNLTWLWLWNNPLSYVSINTHIPAMQANGIDIQYLPSTPTKLLKISGDDQQVVINSELPRPFVVQVQDQWNRPFTEVPITFSITSGNGKLTNITTKTDNTGNAKTQLTLGETAGTTIIQASAPNISQDVQFTAISILPDATVTFPNVNLRTKITETLGKLNDAPITAAEMLTLTSLTANNANISDLTGLQYAANLKTLRLDNNNLSSLDALVQFTQLETLSLENNKISEIAPILQLTELKTLRLRGNPLSYPSLYTTIPTLRNRGIDVEVDPRTPTTLINIPGTPGVAGDRVQIIVQVQDQNGIAFSRVPVNFTLTAADGHLSTAKAISNRNGTATAILTLGTKPGENAITATVIEIPQPLNFTITALDPNTVVHIPDMNLRAKIAEILSKPNNAKINAADMSKVTQLSAPNANIQNLTGLEHAHRLRILNLGAEYIDGIGLVNSNTIADLSPLIGLTELISLNLSYTTPTDISVLSGLPQLIGLYLDNNGISDVSPLTDMTQLTSLGLSGNAISDVSPLSGLTQLERLYLGNNAISDVLPLADMTKLTSLGLSGNAISDIPPLADMTKLILLSLSNNAISDISVLSKLTQLKYLHLSSNAILDVSPPSGLTQLEYLYLQGNLLSYVSINTHIPAMQANGIEVQYTPRTPTKLLKVSGDAQQALINAELPLPLVVQVKDQWNRPFAQVPVTFTITTGNGKLSDTTTKTDNTGNAKTQLTLGENAGTITIQASAPNISQAVQFTATSISLNTTVTLPDVNLRTKITETLDKPNDAPITIAEMLTLTSLTANNANISNLTGLQHAANLTTLRLDNNNLASLDALGQFTQLETLSIENNKISDITPILQLTELKTLRLRGNLLSYTALYTTIPTLQNRGIDIAVDPRTPTTLTNIPGLRGVAGETLQVTVQVQDQNGIAFAGVPVNFTLTAADGHISTAQTISNLNGKATATLTLGTKPGENTITAKVTEIPQPLNFTITALDPSTLVHIPDVNLHAKIAETLSKPNDAKINTTDMSKITRLSAPNANVQDLTGLEHAHNLKELNLGAQYIDGKGTVNSNKITDFSPLEQLPLLDTLVLHHSALSDLSVLAGLTQLTSLDISNNSISNVSALSTLTQLEILYLSNNSISDVSALLELKNLTALYLSSNNISDMSTLSELKQLEVLSLVDNNISDISVLSELKNLTFLGLASNNISDISALSELTNLADLRLRNNPLSYVSINTHIPAMQAKGIEIEYDNVAHPALSTISGNNQEDFAGSILSTPFVVEAQDANGEPMKDIPITFTVETGSGQLTSPTTTTDDQGRAQTQLMLGWTPGRNTVRATAEGIKSWAIFSATGIEPETQIAEDVNRDGVVDVEDLILVAATIGTTPPDTTIPNTDVNGDGVVNADDLALVMAALETTPTAPAAVWTAANLQRWIDEAKQLENNTTIFQRGIARLEQLLATLLPKKRHFWQTIRTHLILRHGYPIA